MREAGAREYDREVGELAGKADEIDALWQKHREFCQGTIAVTVGNAYGREWFGIYTTINAADTPECKMMIQDMRTLAEEIDAGMEAAWEKAHRAGVYPGRCAPSSKSTSWNWIAGTNKGRDDQPITPSMKTMMNRATVSIRPMTMM